MLFLFYVWLKIIYLSIVCFVSGFFIMCEFLLDICWEWIFASDELIFSEMLIFEDEGVIGEIS